MDYKIINDPHTAMIRVTARLNETMTYIRHYNDEINAADLKKSAWSQQWFGFLSESIFNRLMPTLSNRFGKYSYLMEILQRWSFQGIENHDFKLICHFHIQISDPYYRWATGEYIPARFNEGIDEITKSSLAKALSTRTVNPLNANTLHKLSRNILTTARDTGLLQGKTDKTIAIPASSVEVLGYLLYALRLFDFSMSEIPESPYIQSVFRNPGSLRNLLTEGQAKNWWEYNWEGRTFAINYAYADINPWFETIKT